ncbi:MAG: sigma-70 family RNA polymerase sigma factor [Agarilytica sp.]
MESAQNVLRRELSRLRRFAYSLTGSAADADDLVHDLAVKILEKGLPDMPDPVPWMITLCKNLWIDELRYRAVRSRKNSDGAGSSGGSSQSDGSEAMDVNVEVCNSLNKVYCHRVVEGLQALPEGQRVALSLVTIEGMSYAETAKVLDVPIGTVMSRVARARAMLLEIFSDKTETTL